MPGLTFVYNPAGGLNEVQGRIDSSVRSQLFNNHYSNRIVLSTDQIYLSINSYEGYPIQVFENEQYIILVEGLIYERKTTGELPHELILAAVQVIGVEIPNYDVIQSWLEQTDGDFLIIVYDKETMGFVILNDPLGRLPVYYNNHINQFVLSRNIGFVTEFLKPNPDKLGISQYLLTGYPWGQNTLFQDIFYLPNGSVVSLHRNNGIVFKGLFDFNFDQINTDVADANQAGEESAMLFTKALKGRLQHTKKHVLSLSGGLDSRAILAGCSNLNQEIACATYLDYRNEVIDDVRIAEKLVSSFNASMNLIQLNPPNGKNFHDLLLYKQGLNYLGMAFILPFFEEISRKRATYFTGDGGDKVFPDLRPGSLPMSHEKLLKHILKHHAIFSLKEVSSFMDYNEKELFEELINHLFTYPEKHLNHKYIHFQVYERAMKWLFEGEDRNRYFFWSVTPFYAYPLFQFTMTLDHDFKKDYLLYKKFLENISHTLVYIDNANWGKALGNPGLKNYLKINRLKSKLPKGLKALAKRSRNMHYIDNYPDSPLVHCFHNQTQLSQSNAVIRWDVANRMKSLAEDQFLYLLTLSSYFEKQENRNSSLLNYEYQEVF